MAAKWWLRSGEVVELFRAVLGSGEEAAFRGLLFLSLEFGWGFSLYFLRWVI